MEISASTRLFQPLQRRGLSLNSRIVMAPMTRSRTAQPGNIATPLMAEYYAQRSSAALIISEATQISSQGQGYSQTPGIHSAQQIKGWRVVTNAVHKAGGKIFCQLWHVGRMSHPLLHQGEAPVAPSAIAPNAQVWLAPPLVPQSGLFECPIPRALSTNEVKAIIQDYRHAAENAIEAGFDGVEIHAANGYLIDQFLRSSSNTRNDEYGGTSDKRIRFALDVATAITQQIGSDRVGIRLSPHVSQRGMEDPEITTTVLKLATHLSNMKLCYLHIAESDQGSGETTPEVFRYQLRQSFKGAIIVAGGYRRDNAEEILQRELADLVAFGRPFIANPDLPKRLRENLPLADYDESLVYGGDALGYTSYSNYMASPRLTSQQTPKTNSPSISYSESQ